jgi:hypothetical protein
MPEKNPEHRGELGQGHLAEALARMSFEELAWVSIGAIRAAYPGLPEPSFAEGMLALGESSARGVEDRKGANPDAVAQLPFYVTELAARFSAIAAQQGQIDG